MPPRVDPPEAGRGSGGRGGGDPGFSRGGGFPAGGPPAGGPVGRACSSSSLPAPHVEVQLTQGLIYHYDGASTSSILPKYLIDSPAAPSAAI